MNKLSLFKLKRGFTLIELIIIIALIGILAAVAMPQFIDMSSDARQGSVKSIAGALKAANKINKVSRRALSKGENILTTSNCAAAATALLDGGLPSGYTVTPTTAFGGSAYDTHTCTITDDVSSDAETFPVTTTG